MKLCGFEAGLDKPLFVTRGASVEGGAGAPTLVGDATPERRGPAVNQAYSS